MRIYQQLAIATVGVALSIVVGEATPARAETITYDFSFTLTSGAGALQSSIGNQYNGSFSYDDSQILFSDPKFGGFGYIAYPTEFSLNFNNIDYTVTNIVPYRRGQGGTLLHFTPSGDSFQLNTFELAAKNPGSTQGLSFNLDIFGGVSGGGGVLYFANDGQGSGSLAPAVFRPEPVPESDTTLGVGALGLFGWFLKKKKASSKQV